MTSVEFVYVVSKRGVNTSAGRGWTTICCAVTLWCVCFRVRGQWLFLLWHQRMWDGQRRVLPVSSCGVHQQGWLQRVWALSSRYSASTQILPVAKPYGSLSVRVGPPRWPSGKASASIAEDPGFESRLRRDFVGVESYQRLKNWHSSGYPARRLAL